MGFDWYQPDPAVLCPVCGKPVQWWQGKDGPNKWVVWRQGIATPIAEDVDEEIKSPPEVLAAYHLPEGFVIYGWDDCPCHVQAVGLAPQGVWTRTEIFHMAPVDHWPDHQRWDDPQPHMVAYPLLELWDNDGESLVSVKEARWLTAEEVEELLSARGVRFAIAEEGQLLRWLPLEESEVFWQAEARPHFAAPTGRVRSADFPDGYFYHASEWAPFFAGPSLVVLHRLT